MKVETVIVSLDASVEEIEDNFRQTVRQWLDKIWAIMEPQILDREVKLGLKQNLYALVKPNSPAELDSAISWQWKVGTIDAIGGGSAGRLTLYVADTTLKMKEHEGVTRISATSPAGKTFHTQTTIVV